MFESDALGRMQSRNKAVLEFVLDDLGQRSAQAQGLGAVITTVRKMMHTDQRIYIHRSDRAINGMIKVGRKNLFIRDNASGKMHEINPLCVLDFYVHESVQRGGIGKQLFEEMLGKERLDPSEFGYDRPSPKLMGFLRKHYGLVDFDHQPNNFVVFKQYFKKATSAQRKPENGRRLPLDAPEFDGEICSGGVAGDDRTSWQRSNRSGSSTSNCFFLGGSGGSTLDAPNRRDHSHSQQRNGVPVESTSADAQLHAARTPPNSVSAPPNSTGGNWTSKLSNLAASLNGQQDSLAEFARERDDSRGNGHVTSQCERETAQRLGATLGMTSANSRDKSLQEEASHFIYGARRPPSGRRAPFAPLPSGSQGGSREGRTADRPGPGVSALGGGGVFATSVPAISVASLTALPANSSSNQWRTANSEIGAWNKHNPESDSLYGGGGARKLTQSALHDRRVGNRLW